MEPILFYYSLLIVASLLQLVSSRVDSYGGWNDTPDTQYHIQTDEGEERYFKYQTKTGQYRKEKRLQDGTVVGTYGWVDPNGYLRLRDYIADNAGYRILKSRMLFVGDNADVGNSVAAAKNVPGTAGELVSPNSSPFNSYSKASGALVSPNSSPFNSYSKTSGALVSPTRSIYVPPLASQQTYVAPTPFNIYVPPMQNSIDSSTPASTYRLFGNLGPQYFPTSTPSPVFYSSTPATVSYQSTTPAPQYYTASSPSSIHYFPSSTPVVDIHPNSAPKLVSHVYISSTAAPPTDSTPRPIAVYSPTPKPIAVNYVSSTTEHSNPSPVSYVSSTPSYESVHRATPSPAYSAIGYTASTPSPIQRPPPISGKYASPINNFITETEKNKLFYRNEDRGGYYRKRFVNYKPAEQEYDGISTVQNGFRYFLPRQYHEEQSSPSGQERTGSYGYIDPFGIRRVVYYNTSPGRGFEHRKNNRYVGFNAAPYDPRPN